MTEVRQPPVSQAPAISFHDPDIQICPFAAYDRLRVEAPVYHDPVTGHYVLTRYDDVRKVLIDHRKFSSDANLLGRRKNSVTEQIEQIYLEKGWPIADSVQLLDEPEHRAKRSLLDRAFSHWNVQGIVPYIEHAANELIDRFFDRGECEFVSEFAVHLTMRVIARQLGVMDKDPEQFDRDAEKLRFWSDCALEINSPTISPERELELTNHILDFQHFSVANIRRLIADPDDTLLSNLIDAVRGENGEPDLPEVIQLMRTVVVAGNETTRFSLVAGIKTLIDNPELQDEIRGDASRIEAFVEEVLRLMAPVQTLFRRAKEEVTIGDVVIPAAALVEVRYGAANRDPETFDKAAQLDLDRSGSKHLTFGFGIHGCIGAQLARAELRTAFRLILDRMENLRLRDGAEGLSYTSIYISYGITRLELAFDRRAGDIR